MALNLIFVEPYNVALQSVLDVVARTVIVYV